MTSTQKTKKPKSGLSSLETMKTSEEQSSNPYNAPTTSLTPADRILKIADLKGTIRQLEDSLKNEIETLQAEIELGLLDELEDDGSFHYGGVRCTPYETKRWSYPSATKEAIKTLQERAIYDGNASQSITKSLRITL